MTRQKRKKVQAFVPARKRELRLGCSYVVCSCRSRQATPGLEYSRARSSKKSHRTSERGPSAERRSAVKRRLETSGEKVPRRRTSSDITVHGPAQTQGDVRASFSGRLARASGEVVAGPGL